MTDAEAILAFWYAEGRDTYRPIWFQKNDEFDAEIRARFGALIRPAREGAFDSWARTPTGALALLILLDQFPRNLFRGSAEAFASDAHARAIARAVVLEQRFDLRLGPYEKPFLYLPFEHSEAMADQDVSVALFEGLRDIPHHARE
ncbi:MAG: DUF924 family protein, partial [Alphaproteobacteria bacterium]